MTEKMESIQDQITRIQRRISSLPEFTFSGRKSSCAGRNRERLHLVAAISIIAAIALIVAGVVFFMIRKRSDLSD